MPCTTNAFSFGGGSIYVDTNNYTKPYPYRPPKAADKQPDKRSGRISHDKRHHHHQRDALCLVVGIHGHHDQLGLEPAPIGRSRRQPLLPTPVVLTDARLNSVNANGGYCGPTYASGNFGVSGVRGRGSQRRIPG